MSSTNPSTEPSIGAVSTDQAPTALGPYSQAVSANGLLFISGQLGISPESGELVTSSFRDEALQVLNNLEAIRVAAGNTGENITAKNSAGNFLKLTVYLVDLNDFAELNEIMQEQFAEPYPARACVEVKALPKSARLEIDAIAVVQE